MFDYIVPHIIWYCKLNIVERSYHFETSQNIRLFYVTSFDVIVFARKCDYIITDYSRHPCFRHPQQLPRQQPPEFDQPLRSGAPVAESCIRCISYYIVYINNRDVFVWPNSILYTYLRCPKVSCSYMARPNAHIYMCIRTGQFISPILSRGVICTMWQTGCVLNWPARMYAL